jgi:hypothetical protein
MLGAGAIAEATKMKSRCQEFENPIELVPELMEVKAQIWQ